MSFWDGSRGIPFIYLFIFPNFVTSRTELETEGRILTEVTRDNTTQKHRLRKAVCISNGLKIFKIRIIFNMEVKFLRGRVNLTEKEICQCSRSYFLPFSFWLKLRCPKVWKAFLASLANKMSNPFSVPSLGLNPERESLDSEETPICGELRKKQ